MANDLYAALSGGRDALRSPYELASETGLGNPGDLAELCLDCINDPCLE